ncbi:MAG: leucine-rich repeat protein [Clostridia bacterium]|nr:leucine-rich repeat protein [Clostridia bacterium]
MKKQLQKLLAVVLLIIMILSVLSVIPFTAFADSFSYNTEIFSIEPSSLPNCLSINCYLNFSVVNYDSVGLEIVKNGVTVLFDTDALLDCLCTTTIDFDWTNLMGYGDGEFVFYICSCKKLQNGDVSCSRLSAGFKYSVKVDDLVKTSYSGKCGANLQWNIDTKGTLRIFGEGDMEDYLNNSAIGTAPWLKYYSLIKKIIVEEGVTGIGDYSFYCCLGWNVTEVSLPNSLERIGKIAFYGCLKSGEIVIPKNVKQIGERAFKFCKGTIYAPYGIGYDFSDDSSENLSLVYYYPEPEEDTPQIVVESKKARAGKTVDVNISLKNNPGITSAKIKVYFPAGLTLEDVNFGDIGGQTMMSESWNSPVTLNWFIGNKDLKDTDITFATLTFKLADDIETGAKEIGIEFDPDDIFDIANNVIDFVAVGGEIEVIGYEPGDISDDGKVNNQDLVLLFQYLSGWDVTVNQAAVDVNGDGSVDNIDLIRLFQYLCGWAVDIF